MKATRHVGVFISNTNPFGQGVLEGISDYCRARNDWKLAISWGDENKFFQRLGDNLDGVIAGVQDGEFAAALAAWGKPCVDVFSRVPSPIFPRVNLDHQAIGRWGAEHLLGLGLKQLAFCGFQDYPFAHVRQEAFRGAVERAGGSCFIHQVDTHTSDWPAIWKAIAAWVAALPKPVGLMAAVDSLALEVLDACKELDLRVPADVAVLGVNNDDLICERAYPPLSSVDPGVARVGYQAARVLDDLLSGHAATGETVLFPPIAVIGRDSTDMRLLEDPQLAAALRYIREHACDPIQVQDILTAVPLSRRALELRFEQVLGRSPHEEIRRVQLQKAQRLLARPHLPLEQVAQASGLGSAVAMVRVFHKELGVTPGEYRRRCTPEAAAAGCGPGAGESPGACPSVAARPMAGGGSKKPAAAV